MFFIEQCYRLFCQRNTERNGYISYLRNNCLIQDLEGINILKRSSKSYIELHVGTYKKLVTNSYVKKRTETWELLNLHRLFELERDFRTGQHSRPNMVQKAPLCHICGLYLYQEEKEAANRNSLIAYSRHLPYMVVFGSFQPPVSWDPVFLLHGCTLRLGYSLAVHHTRWCFSLWYLLGKV